MAGRALRRDVSWIPDWPGLYLSASVEPSRVRMHLPVIHGIPQWLVRRFGCGMGCPVRTCSCVMRSALQDGQCGSEQYGDPAASFEMVCGVIGIGRDAMVDSLPSYVPLKLGL